MNQAYNLQSLLKEHIVVVPEMQRDYVWSITSDNVYKLLKMIDETSTAHIGFIYAFRQGNKVCLIDGQQRLTTLVLLTFYLSLHDDGACWSTFQKMIRTSEGELRFTYRVRETAKNFMEQLFLSKTCPTYDDLRKLKAETWNNDTTVENMIEALHIIDRYVQMTLFGGTGQSLDFNHVVKDVMFYYTDIEQTVQGRDIYITLNTCGQPLAKYERLKPFLVGNNLKKCEIWNTWEDWLYRRTKEQGLDKRTVDTAMENFLRLVFELKTGREAKANWVTVAESSLTFEEAGTYFEALKSLYDTCTAYSKEVMELFTPAETKNGKRYFRKLKALLLVCILSSPHSAQREKELKRMDHLVTMCLRGKKMDNKDLLPFLYKFKQSHRLSSQCDLYAFINRSADDSIVTSCLHPHEIRKIQLIQRGTERTEALFLQAEQLGLYYTNSYYCLLNALWDEKFTGEVALWSSNDDGEFEKRMETFTFLFRNKWKPLEEPHEVNEIDNAFLARYLLSQEPYDYYLQEKEYRWLGRNDSWREMLSNRISCNRISQMVGTLCHTASENMYSIMEAQINRAWQNYTRPHDARYYILKYPDSLRAKYDGWNKLRIESILNDRKTWNSFNIIIYSAPQNLTEGRAVWMFESLLAHAAPEYCRDEWNPMLSNGIGLANGRDRHGWRIYDNREGIDRHTTRSEITRYLNGVLGQYADSMRLSPAKEEDDFVFVDIINNHDLIEGGCHLLKLLKDYPTV